MISKIEQEIDEEREEKLQQNSSNVLTWILKEIQEKQEDYITIVCKDGQKCRVSCLLMAAVSPFLADVLSKADLDDCTIFMPDVEVNAVTRIFERIYMFGALQDFELEKSDYWSDDPLQINGKFNKDPFRNIFFNGRDKEHFATKEDPEVKCEPKDFDFIESDTAHLTSDTVIIKRNQTNHDQSKVSVLTKIEFDVNPLEFASDDLLQSEKEVNRNKSVIMHKNKGALKRKKKNVHCEECGVEIASRLLVQHVKEVHRSEPISCNICQESFYIKSDFDKHKNSENCCDPIKKAKLEMLQCDCGLQCADKSDLTAHQQDGCEGIPPLSPQGEIEGDIEEEIDGDLDDVEFNNDEEMPLTKRRKKDLSNNNSIHKSSKKFKCQICKKDFDTIKKRSVHRRRAHVNLTCQTCQQEFILESELKTHVETEHKAVYSQKFKCDMCPAMFAFPDKLKRHLQIKHSDVVKSYSCHICNLTSPYLTNIKRHIQKHHETDNKKKKVICEDCGKSFATQKSLEYKIHMAYHQADKFSCECQILFDNRKQKVHHMQVVHLKELLGCDKCLYMCMDPSQLINHEKNIHQVEKPKQVFICDICGAEYKSAGSLKEHKERKHYPKVEECPHCMKEMPAIDIKRHIRKNHTDSGICNVCGVQAKCLKKHMKAAHTPKHLAKYKCEFCDKGFPYKAGLDRHRMNNHLKLRPYKCRYGCESAFNDSSNRNQHEKKIHGVTFNAKNNNIDDIKAE